MSSPHGATWRSGYATVCKTVYSGSIPDVASTFKINDLGEISKAPSRAKNTSTDPARTPPPARSAVRPCVQGGGRQVRGTRSRDAIYGVPDQHIARGLRTASSGMLRRWHLTSIKP
jgi:hypothetical protein